MGAPTLRSSGQFVYFSPEGMYVLVPQRREKMGDPCRPPTPHAPIISYAVRLWTLGQYVTGSRSGSLPRRSLSTAFFFGAAPVRCELLVIPFCLTRKVVYTFI
ncbi:hypothetical protein K437DRAFT_401 [Tilletiaria anomala UBC 951]|uniref:Uncharacterized protein n=1 Tax=Tilletiaria anomala (strain ATCC 24038 / CBS 436.72 / UBC 951) TaxID=1037660 RepID=A0A066WHN0_TILAU|nr:uncharacterized protein K437DRAFT_401 [Tilletiaria anomala UBC 951]KDN53507.1 hypothetical protein K437DRAFT_401 [Tilletiaria anomala UBC 951]